MKENEYFFQLISFFIFTIQNLKPFMKRTAFILIIFLQTFLIFSQEKLIEKKLNSQLKIPFNHFIYNDLENKLNNDTHTGLRPLYFYEIDSSKYISQYKNLVFKKNTWLGRKLFNEHFFVIDDKDYFITIDPLIDLRIGKDNHSQYNYVFQNTRGIRVEGSLGKDFSFSSTVMENWARFPKFLDRYAWVHHPPTIPGWGLNKSEDRKFVDYPFAEGYATYAPGKYFLFELGHGKNFIGEGYRSLLLSDNAPVYPYFKIQATFWKVKYTTIWSAYQDIRPEVTSNGVFKKKFSATHFIDWNALPKLNIGFFETVIWYNENRRGFDVNFLNPLIFFKTAEYEAGSNGSNTILGLNGSWKAPYHLKLYGQLVLDEMTVSKFFGESGYWANKFGYQIGIKSIDAFDIPNLFLRLEFNTIRPYTYGHGKQIVNYSHFYQSLAHPFGANFKETIFEVQYRYKRWYIHNILNFAQKGFDFDDTYHYGGNINAYIYPENKGDYIQTLQGNLGKLLQNNLEAGYLLNPATNLKIFGGVLYRKTQIEQEINLVKNETTRYFYLGIRTDLWNNNFNVF